jgi:hypothetical protein
MPDHGGHQAVGGENRSSSGAMTRYADIGLTVLLVSLCLLIFVVLPFMARGSFGRTLVTVGLSLVLASAVFAVSGRWAVRATAIGLLAISLVAQWASRIAPGEVTVRVMLISAIAFLALTAACIFRQVLQPGRITAHRVRGAIALYLLLGVIWAFVYILLELHAPGALVGDAASGLASIQSERLPSQIYFSFVTLTTLGYGDISPASPAARSFAILEALVGQIYIVAVIARLVSLRTSGKGGVPPEGSRP